MIVGKNILLFTCTFFCYLANAQKTKLEWGDVEKRANQAPGIGQIVAGQPSEIITLSFKGDNTGPDRPITPILCRYDNNLKPISEKELYTTEKGISYHSFINSNGHLLLFTKQYDRDNKFTAFHATQIDPVNLSVISTKELGKFEALGKNQQANIILKQSADSSVFLVYAGAPYEKKGNEKFNLSVWDNKLNKQWERMITLPYPDKDIRVDGIEVSNEKEVYMLCKHYDKGTTSERVYNKGDQEPAYTYMFLIYSPNSQTPTEVPLDVQNKFVHGIALQFNKEGDIQIMGLYKEKSWFSAAVSGCFRATFNKNAGKITVEKMEAFPKEGLLKQLDNDDCGRAGKEDPGMLFRVRIMGTNKRDDGSVDLITEENWSYIRNTRTSPNSSGMEYPVYIVHSIVVINFKKDGSIVYTRVPKRQEVPRSGVHVGCKWMSNGNNLLFFYNERKDNLTRDIAKTPKIIKKFEKSVFVMATVDEKGNVTRTPMYNNDDLEVTTIIPTTTLIAPNQLALYALRTRNWGKAKFQFGRITVL